MTNISIATFKPYDDQLVIKVDAPVEYVSESGLTLAAVGEKEYVFATVLSVGPGITNYNSADATRIPISSKVGDKVLAAKAAINERRLPNGEILQLIEEKHVLGAFGDSTSSWEAPEVPMTRYGA